MAIIRYRNADGTIKEVVCLKGEKGDKGDAGGSAAATTVENGNDIRIPHGGGQSAPLGNNVQNALENLADAFNGPYIYTDTKTEDAMQFARHTFCNALKGKAEGELVTLRDVSPVRHTVEVSVGSKNILPFPYKDTTKTYNGITWTVNEDGTITANGTASGDSVFQLTDTFPYNDGLICRISGCPTGGSADTYYLYSVFTGHREIGSGMSMTISDSRYWNFRIYIKNGYTANNLVFKPQVEKGTTATPYTPYIEDTSAVKVQVRGKNWYDSTLSFGGLSGGDGTEFDSTDYVRTDFIEAKPNTVYNVSGGDIIPPDYAGRHAYDKDKNWIAPMSRVQSSSGEWMNDCFTTPPNTAYVRLHFFHADKTTGFTQEQVDALNAADIQLEVGTTATDYEPYKAPIEYSQYEAISSISPNMTVTTDTDGAMVTVDYNRDINKAFEALMQMVATTGGNV